MIKWMDLYILIPILWNMVSVWTHLTNELGTWGTLGSPTLVPFPNPLIVVAWAKPELLYHLIVPTLSVVVEPILSVVKTHVVSLVGEHPNHTRSLVSFLISYWLL